MSATIVYLVHHVHELPGGAEDIKLIGVYSTRGKAQDAIRRVYGELGFRDCLEGFSVDKYEIDKDHWVEGYVTLP